MIRPLRGRVIVSRESQVHSDVLFIPDTFKEARSIRTADRGHVLAVGEMPDGVLLHDALEPGDDVFYLGPEDRLAVDCNGVRAFAVAWYEVIGVVE